ncbi:hypothetical protein [Sphingobium sp.]|uniref:hypothetical protein n=1 Tax=Sphingobium sp. TaxID=1912891 RepID=UPI0028BF09C0|nr:hypothetical protein [Sphingobium sp.]
MRRLFLPVLAGMAVAGLVSIAVVRQGAAASPPANPVAPLPELEKLPDLLGTQWIPEGVGDSEVTRLATIPLPAAKPAYQQEMKKALAGLKTGQVKPMSADCRLEGMPRLAWFPYPLQFLYGPGAVMIRANGFVRGVATNSLKHPDELFDSNALQGFSIMGDQRASWEGDTLVIDTVKVREDRDLFYGLPFDPDLHVEERYRLTGQDMLERVTTITAPHVLTAPWVVRTRYRRGPDASLANYNCMLPGEPVT